MDTFSAMLRGEASRNDPVMVFDWYKAATLIREEKPNFAAAGLKDDWGWTGGCIWSDGKPYKGSYTYLASTWAEPLIVLDHGDPIPCWIYMKDSPGWDSDTKWPLEAENLLK